MVNATQRYTKRGASKIVIFFSSITFVQHYNLTALIALVVYVKCAQRRIEWQIKNHKKQLQKNVWYQHQVGKINLKEKMILYV